METNTEPQTTDKTQEPIIESNEIPFVDIKEVNIQPQNNGYAYAIILPDGNKHNVVVIAPSATDAKEKLLKSVPVETKILWKEFVATHVF